MFADWLGRYGRAVGLLSAVLGTWLLFGAGSAYAQQGAIAGTITDSETFQPVAGAQVFVPGTVVGTLTGERGTFRLEGVPVGQVTVTVRLIGYKEASLTVDVAGGQVTTADFVVEQTALRLQDIIVTGVIGATPRVKLPFTVERLDAADIPVPGSDAARLLTGKAPGVTVVRGSGQPGAGASVALRGPTSIDASGRSQAPLLVIDGVIQSENATISDVGALDIDHVEIVKGAAAASLYGSRAQNGVISISTKRGSGLATNTFQVLARGEYGINQIEGSIELTNGHPYQMTSDQTAFLGAGDIVVTDFTNLGRPASTCATGAVCAPSQFDDGGTTETTFADNPWPVSFDHLDTFFDPGETFSAYGAVTGRFGEASFRVSAEEFKEQGVISCSTCQTNLDALNATRAASQLAPFDVPDIDDEGFERQNVRMNVDTRFGNIDIAASGFYSRSTQDDAAVSNGSFFALTFMSPGLDLTRLDPSDGLPIIDIDPLSAEENPLYQLAIGESFDERTRTMGSFDATWEPTDFLSFQANASYDRTDFESVDMRFKNEKTSEGGLNTFTGGSLDRWNFIDEAVNASVTASFNRAYMDGDMTVRLKARYLVEDQEFTSNGVEGNNFSVDGVPTFGAIDGDQEGRSEIEEIKAEGYFGIASFDYRGKYILDGLVRRDGSSLFGEDERWATYWRGSAAWRIAQEDWWNIDAIDEFKLRFSYGTAGGRPRFSAQYETFGVGSGQIFPVNLGNSALKPEFSTEREAGLNLVLFESLGIDYTYAWQNTEDQLLLVPQPAFVGFSAQWQNAGEIQAKTHELSIRWAAIDNSDMGLQFRVNWDRTENEIVSLDVPPYKITEPDGDGEAFFIAPGRPLGEMWGDVWATSCSELAPVGISASDCSANFGVNDEGLLVWTGGADVGSGISGGLWGTSGTVATNDYKWGFPIKVMDKSPICVAEKNGDPGDECQLQSFLPMGNTTPDWNGSFAANFRYKGFAVTTLLDAAVGHDIYNGTRQWPIRELRGAAVSQLGKADSDKKPIGYTSELYNVNAENSFFVEKGDWLKIRELSLGYTLPQSTLQSWFGGTIERLSISLIGRNLLTFTDYQGYDPEVGQGGGDLGSATLTRTDRFGYPNFRTYSASLEIVF